MKVTLGIKVTWNHMEVLSLPFRLLLTLTRVQCAWPGDLSSGTCVTDDQAKQLSERKGSRELSIISKCTEPKAREAEARVKRSGGTDSGGLCGCKGSAGEHVRSGLQ